MKHISEQKVEKFINLVNKEYKKNGGNSETFQKCINVCFESQNIAFMIEFCAKVKGVDIEKFSDFIAENGTPAQNLAFAARVKNADKQKHADVVAKSGDAELCYQTAKLLKGIDTTACGEVVLEKGAYYTNYLFARDVRTANFAKHQEVVFQSNNIDLIYTFAMNIDKGDAFACYNKLVELKANSNICYNVYSKLTNSQKLSIQVKDMLADFENNKQISKDRINSIEYYAKLISKDISCCPFASDKSLDECAKACLKVKNAELLLKMTPIRGFNKTKFAEVIAESGTNEENLEFIDIINKMTSDRLVLSVVLGPNVNKILESKDPKSNYLCAKNNKHPGYIEQHEAVVLNAKSVEMSKLFAANIKGANILEHQKVVMELGTVKDVVEFIKNVPDANKKLAFACLEKKGASKKVLRSVERQLTNDQKLSVMIDEFTK